MESEDQTHKLRPGDEVFWVDYGHGRILDVNRWGFWALWERAGQLHHNPGFAKYIRTVDDN